jgi:LL-diaminopimelate aminotransferase
MQLSRRLRALPPYHFAAYNRKIAEMRAAGRDIINLSIGDPDLPMAEEVLDALIASAREPVNQRYPEYEGMAALREAFAAWFTRRFGVELDPKREMTTLIGSKEGLAHLPQAVMDEGDVALMPNPAYPVYPTAVALAGGTVYEMALTEESGWLPDLEAIPTDTLARAKTLWLNYPNNPTGAAAPLTFFERAVAFARQHDLLLIHDMAYAEVRFDGARPASVLEVPGAKDVAVEFHSFSKAYNMAGVRLGMMVGNADVCEGLTRLKSNLDTGVFRPLQIAGVHALALPDEWLDQRNAVYQRRRDLLLEALRAAGMRVATPQAGLYLWPRIPDGQTSAEFALRLLEETSVAVTAGTNFGSAGEGYLRVSLTAPDETIAAAAAQLRGAVPARE